MSSTRKAFLALGGNLWSRRSSVLVVVMGTWEGVLSEMLRSCVGAVFHLASFPKMVNEAAQSEYAVSRFG